MKTEIVEVHPEYPDIKQISRCARIIRQGGLVIFPTETVYGIAADYLNPQVMERLRQIKRRPDGKPFSILISQKGLISNYTSFMQPSLYKLINTYWPGPLTVIVPARENEQTIGVRMPDHAIALKLVEETQRTIAAPSANVEGKEPPVTCQEALKDLDGLVDLAIDGGPAAIGKSSSVVDFTKERPTVLREGVITQKDVDGVVGKKSILFVCTGNSCRSVMAEYLLKQATRDRDDLNIGSAGTGVFIRSTASSETLCVLREEGIFDVGHVSQPVNSILLKQADIIFVMTRTHRQQVLERAPEVEKRVYLLKEFANIPPDSMNEMDIPDPIGKPHQAYKECLVMIRDAVKKIVQLI
ncbi:MAG TPA: L-threonylcarbamoyladenylate synthase [Candidatus Omnitrophota bacterium]|nr:L-threonylcarbamoyladenylate synthase [Candidatus Omnitrophota bacterium]